MFPKENAVAARLGQLTSNDTLEGEWVKSEGSLTIPWRRIAIPSTHVDGVAWSRNGGQRGNRNPPGTLYIHYSSGGYPRAYAYRDVPYRLFYYLWREAPSAGKYVYWTFLLRNGYMRSGRPIGGNR